MTKQLPKTQHQALEALAVAVLVVVAVSLAPWLGSDRLVPCGQRRGFDALLGGQGGHVDSPEGGGGCIVPTAGAWTAAAIGAALPVIIWAGSPAARHRRLPGRTADHHR